MRARSFCSAWTSACLGCSSSARMLRPRPQGSERRALGEGCRRSRFYLVNISLDLRARMLRPRPQGSERRALDEGCRRSRLYLVNISGSEIERDFRGKSRRFNLPMRRRFNLPMAPCTLIFACSLSQWPGCSPAIGRSGELFLPRYSLRLFQQLANAHATPHRKTTRRGTRKEARRA